MKVKVILSQDILSLGEEGDVREVAGGYARNYLFPKKLAVAHTRNNMRAFETRKAAIDQRKEAKRTEALGLAERLGHEELKFVMPAGDNGKLFGSVNASMIGEELSKKGYEIERKRIEVPDNHIRQVGSYTIKIRLYGQQEAPIKVVVEGASAT
jgi:large subunit ribosomal protein L9